MKRSFPLILCLSAVFAASVRAGDGPAGSRTGWFGDERCAVARVKSGSVGPSNRECAQKCIKDGAKMVFVDEKAKDVYFVENPETAKGQESHYVRVAGRLNPEAKTFHVASVEVLDEYRASCKAPETK